MWSKSGTVQRRYMKLTIKEIMCQCQTKKCFNKFASSVHISIIFDYPTNPLDSSNRDMAQCSPPALHCIRSKGTVAVCSVKKKGVKLDKPPKNST